MHSMLEAPWHSSRQALISMHELLVSRVVVKESGGINSLDFAALRFSIAALAFVPFLPGALRADENGDFQTSHAHVGQAVLPLTCMRSAAHLVTYTRQPGTFALGGAAGKHVIRSDPDVPLCAAGERVVLKAGLELSVWTALGYFTQALGLMTTDASRASFLSTFTVRRTVAWVAAPVCWPRWTSTAWMLRNLRTRPKGEATYPPRHLAICCAAAEALRRSSSSTGQPACMQVLAVPLLAGSSFGDSRGIPLVTWLSGLGAIVGVSLLEQSGAAPGIGDVWSLLSAIFFGVQVRPLSPAVRQAEHQKG